MFLFWGCSAKSGGGSRSCKGLAGPFIPIVGLRIMVPGLPPHLRGGTRAAKRTSEKAKVIKKTCTKEHQGAGVPSMDAELLAYIGREQRRKESYLKQ